MSGAGTGGLCILGLGNVLCGDDGLGVAALRPLREGFTLPEDVVVLDGGTLGMSLLTHVSDADALLIVDSIEVDAPPGTVVTLREDDVSTAVRERLSVHQVGVADLFDALSLTDRAPREVRLVGVVPESVELRVGLSDAVQRALPELVRRVVEEAEALGYPLGETNDVVTSAGVPGDARVVLGL